MATLRSLAERLGEIDDDLPVVFGGAVYETYPASLAKGELLVPTHYCSYRGFYKCAALVPGTRALSPTVHWLQLLTENTIGQTLTGWKGGEYEMTADEALFVAVEGDATNIGVLDVVVADDRAVLVTHDVTEYVFV